MPVARKAAVSLLICVLLFAGFCFVSFTSLFDKIETQFYDRAILNRLTNELNDDASFIDSYIIELRQRFSDVLRERAVMNSFQVDQNREDIYERGRIFASLGISLPGLQWVRFVDAEGNRIHYSTNPDDQIIPNTETVLFKNYPEVTGYMPFDKQMLSGINLERIVFDGGNENLIFYYPFYDSMNIRRGEALFSVSINAFSERMIENAQVTVNDNLSVISEPAGIVIDVPPLDTEAVKNAVASIWATGSTAFSRIYAPNNAAMSLLSVKTSDGIFIGRLAPEKLFALPDILKALMIGAVFITLFVTLFLMLNMKQDAVAIVQNRLKELQVSLMNEYYQLMGDMDWAAWRRELEQRRDDVKDELCRGIKIKKGSEDEKYINSFFNKSWDRLLAAIGSKTGMITTFDESKLEAILSRVLNSVKQSGGDSGFQDSTEDETNEVDDIEELSEADEVLEDETEGVLEALDGDSEPAAAATPPPASATPSELAAPSASAAVAAPPSEPAAPLGSVQKTSTDSDLEANSDEAEELEELEEELEGLEEKSEKTDKVEEIEEAEELEEIINEDTGELEEAGAMPESKMPQAESVSSNEPDKGLYDVEEFEAVDTETAYGSGEFPQSPEIPSLYLDDGIYNLPDESEISEIIEDFSNAPKFDFNSISLRSYTPKSIYSAKDLEEFDNTPPSAGESETGDKADAGKAAAESVKPKSSVEPEPIEHESVEPEAEKPGGLKPAGDKTKTIEMPSVEPEVEEPESLESAEDKAETIEVLPVEPETEELKALNPAEDKAETIEVLPVEPEVEELEALEPAEDKAETIEVLSVEPVAEELEALEPAETAEASVPNEDDTAWLKLAGETAAMEPKEIWEQLDPSTNQAAAPAPQAVPQKSLTRFSDILEEDPFGNDAFKNQDFIKDNTFEVFKAVAPAYGEFISAMETNNSRPEFNKAKIEPSLDPQYDVEEFLEVDDDDPVIEKPLVSPGAYKSAVDDYTFETPRKGADINEIAKKIEFAPISNETLSQSDDIDDMNIDISSPSYELFSADEMMKEKAASRPIKPKPVQDAEKPKSALEQNVTSPKPIVKQEVVKPKPVLKQEVPRPKSALKQEAGKPKTAPKQARPGDTKHDQAAAHRGYPPANGLFAQSSGELEFLESADNEEEKPVIKKKRNGVDYIDTAVLKNSAINSKSVNLAMKNLVDSVLRKF